MSIIATNISYTHANGDELFGNISFSISDGQKVSLIGNNGTGKSTLLNIISGKLAVSSGELSVTEQPYSIPQHFGQYNNLTISEALGISGKINALHKILKGDTTEETYATLNDDWDIEDRAIAALTRWGLGHTALNTPFSSLSGGEKTKVFLAGIAIHNPGIILMDEPTNHLDRDSRRQLYRLISNSRATILIVSHDRELLDIPNTTLELSKAGITRYGGNYDFYKEQHEARLNALDERISESEKALRAARRKERETLERKERMDSRGEKKQKQAGVARIMMNTIRDGAEKSAARIKDNHSEKIDTLEKQRRDMREQLPDNRNLKIAIDNSGLHRGKVLIKAEGINFNYPGGKTLWQIPLNLLITSGDRTAILGGNGAGKSTLIKLILGDLAPTEGNISRAEFSHTYIDQEYSMIDNHLTILGQLEKHNIRNLPDSELKTELHRFLFPAAVWDKSCSSLSGGEKLRLMLCCMVVSNDTPDMIILDEPTNNLDIQSMEILTSTLAGYKGTILTISHDSHFLEEIGVAHSIELNAANRANTSEAEQ